MNILWEENDTWKQHIQSLEEDVMRMQEEHDMMWEQTRNDIYEWERTRDESTNVQWQIFSHNSDSLHHSIRYHILIF